jgi:hypothetical protein
LHGSELVSELNGNTVTGHGIFLAGEDGEGPGAQECWKRTAEEISGSELLATELSAEAALGALGRRPLLVPVVPTGP